MKRNAIRREQERDKEERGGKKEAEITESAQYNEIKRESLHRPYCEGPDDLS